MKRIPESKVARWPMSVTKLALMYACCFVLMCMLSFSVCYAYFSAKVEATGSIATGQLMIEYQDGSSATTTELQTTLTRSGETLTEDGENAMIIPEGFTIVPGDRINISGNVKNTGSIDAYVLVQAEFMLMDETDTTIVERTFDSKFYDLSGNLITYDTTNKIYTTPATELAVDGSSNLATANLSYTVNTGLTSEYSGRTFKLRLTILAIQSTNLEDDDTFSSVGQQATNMLLTSTPHLVTDAKIYGNSVQNVGSGKNLFSMQGFVEYQNGLADAGDKGITSKSTIEQFDGKTCLYAKPTNMHGNSTYYYYPISCAENTQYTLSYNAYIPVPDDRISNTVTNCGINFYYTDGTQQSPDDMMYNRIGWQEIYLTSKENKTVAGVSLRYNYDTQAYYTDIQFEQGTTATEYEPYAGKNILNIEQGVGNALVKNNDGSFTITKVGNSRFSATINVNLKANVTYTMSYELIETTATKVVLNSYTVDVGDHYYYSLGKDYNKRTFTPGRDITAIRFYLESTELDGAYTTFRNIQIEYGSVATAYEPYVGSPSPEVPAKIESVGEKTKNLLNIDAGLNNCLTKDGDNYTITKISDADRMSISIPINLYAGITYTFSYELVETNSTYHSAVQFSFASTTLGMGNSIGYVSKNYTPTSDITSIRIYQEGQMPVGTYATFKNLMIEKGDTATEYEPYGYKLDVTQRGKNLFNYISERHLSSTLVSEFSNGAIVNGNDDGSTAFTSAAGVFCPGSTVGTGNKVNLKNGDIVTVSADITLLERNASFSNEIKIGIQATGTIKYLGTPISLTLDTKLKVSQTFIIEEGMDGEYFPLFYLNSHTMKIENIQIEYGDTATEYEPFIGEATTHTIYLDEPLRKVGDVADYIEIKDGVAKVVRMVQTLKITGNENWQMITGTDATPYYVLSIGSKGDVVNNAVLSNLYTTIQIAGANTSVGVYIVNSNGYNDARICLRPDLNEYSTVASWKQFLQDLYNEGKPLLIYYGVVESKKTETIINLGDMFTLAGNAIYEFSGEIAPSDYYFS